MSNIPGYLGARQLALQAGAAQGRRNALPLMLQVYGAGHDFRVSDTARVHQNREEQDDRAYREQQLDEARAYQASQNERAHQHELEQIAVREELRPDPASRVPTTPEEVAARIEFERQLAAARGNDLASKKELEGVRQTGRETLEDKRFGGRQTLQGQRLDRSDDAREDSQTHSWITGKANREAAADRQQTGIDAAAHRQNLMFGQQEKMEGVRQTNALERLMEAVGMRRADQHDQREWQGGQNDQNRAIQREGLGLREKAMEGNQAARSASLEQQKLRDADAAMRAQAGLKQRSVAEQNRGERFDAVETRRAYLEALRDAASEGELDNPEWISERAKQHLQGFKGQFPDRLESTLAPVLPPEVLAAFGNSTFAAIDKAPPSPPMDPRQGAFVRDEESGRTVTPENVRDTTSIAIDRLKAKHPAVRLKAIQEMQADPERFRAMGIDVQAVLDIAGNAE